MPNDLSRRNFIKTTGTIAGAAALAGAGTRSFAANERINLGIIGTGLQAQIAHIGQGLNVHKDKIQIVAICDVWNYNRDLAAKAIDDPGLKQYSEYRDMIEKENLDAVLIATPLVTHYQIVLDCLDAGLYVFCEKTLTMTIEESRDIVKKCEATGKFLQVGHQRRYNPYYNKAMWLANDKNLIGRITHITAQWHRNDSWRRTPPRGYVLDENEKKHIKDLEKHVNWRLYNDMSAGLMTELGTHQLDVASWFLGGIPSRVMGMGGLEYWRDKREAEDHVVLIYEWDMKPGMKGFKQVKRRSSKQSKIKINAPYKVRMTYSSICTNANAHYSELIQGEFGALELVGESRCQVYAEPSYVAAEQARRERAEAKKAQLEGNQSGTAEKKDPDAETTTSYDPSGALNEGIPLDVYTDDKQSTDYDIWMANHNSWAGFANDIKNGGIPKANVMAGLSSAICGHAGNEAIRTGSSVEIDSKLMDFDFETPDPYRFDFVEGPIPGAKPAKDDAEETV